MKKFTSKLVASAMAATMAMSMIGGFGASAVECEEHNNVGSFLISDSIVNMANAYNPNLTGHYLLNRCDFINLTVDFNCSFFCGFLY